VAVAEHIQAQGRIVDMGQVELDSQGHPGSSAAAAGDNTRLLLEAGLMRQLRQSS
jgi:hypothetical protein